MEINVFSVSYFIFLATCRLIAVDFSIVYVLVLAMAMKLPANGFGTLAGLYGMNSYKSYASDARNLFYEYG